MRYLITNPLNWEEAVDEYDIELIEEEPPTEPRPDLAEEWAKRMNDVPDVCKNCGAEV